MSDDDAPRGDDLQERAHNTNSNLLLLIEAIGELLSASTELLTHLQRILSGAQPGASGTNGSGEPGTTPLPEAEQPDC